MIKIRTIVIGLVFTLTLVAAPVLSPRVAGARAPEANEPQARSSFHFSGTELTLSGTVDEGCDVLIKVTGPVKKVKLGNDGLIPSEYPVVDNLPRLYKVLTSCSIAQISPEIKNKLGINNHFSILGSKAVVYSQQDENKSPITGPERERQISRAIRINEQNGRYKLIENSISIENGKFRGTLHIDPKECGSQLQIQVISLKDNTIVNQQNENITVPLNFLNRAVDIEKEPFLFIGIFFSLTILTAIGFEEIIGKGAKEAFR